MMLRIATAIVVLLLTGCASQPDQSAQTATPDADQTTGTATAGDTLTFVAQDIAYAGAPSQAPAGPIVVELINEGSIEHDVTIEERGDQVVTTASGGETTSGQVDLEPGTYTYYCSIPGHRAAGMEGTLTVED